MSNKRIASRKVRKPNTLTPGSNGETDQNSQSQTNQQPGGGKSTLLIQRIYLKSSSSNASQLPVTFGKEWRPEVDLNIQSSNTLLSNNLYQVELNITVNGKLKNETIFSVNVIQADVFVIENFAKEQLDIILGSECLKILYPYVREAITDYTSRATLPLLYLAPINFDAIYSQQLQKKTAKNE